MKNVTVEECKEIWGDYQKLLKDKTMVMSRLAMMDSLLQEVEAQLYYVRVQMELIKSKLNEP